MEQAPNWDLYWTFLHVLREGSLSAAARELGLTQPTVGRHIDTLEQMIGAQLFTRSPHGLLATDVALELQPYAAAMAANAAALVRMASAQHDKVEGTIRIGASEVIGVEVLPGIIAQLLNTYPALHIELSASDTVEDLLNREVDIAVRMAEPSQDALLVRNVGSIPLGLYAHSAYIARYGTPRTVADLKKHRLIGFDRQTAFVRAIEKRFPVTQELKFIYRTDSNLAQLAAIRAGIGIGICQDGLAQDNPELIHLLPDQFSIGLPTWIAMHENLGSSHRFRLVFETLINGMLGYIKKTAATKPGRPSV
ncbi:LysR family transcriptional regulator (plasmid) [Phyllobacterium sp. 628]|uniref:LysR family transcriptional regulator n=1 Tax=Phyllobacterium sp. 628 TaxID=2718938 RepID=UPI001662678A|nr:LysR family transcriptional regulator [Phyllobacterium sp. 628]QND54822.1 LysR family transcriptional regulator [Phyllobacterium sp. 628]